MSNEKDFILFKKSGFCIETPLLCDDENIFNQLKSTDDLFNHQIKTAYQLDYKDFLYDDPDFTISKNGMALRMRENKLEFKGPLTHYKDNIFVREFNSIGLRLDCSAKKIFELGYVRSEVPSILPAKVKREINFNRLDYIGSSFVDKTTRHIMVDNQKTISINFHKFKLTDKESRSSNQYHLIEIQPSCHILDKWQKYEVLLSSIIYKITQKYDIKPHLYSKQVYLS